MMAMPWAEIVVKYTLDISIHIANDGDAKT